jgi:hypothetical protein
LKRARSSSQYETPVPKRLKRQEEFAFKEHCLFCGERCNVTIDKKNPNRAKKSSLCQSGQTSLKEAILDVCKKQNDDKSNAIQVRLHGAVSDLAAVGARYHRDCASKFLSLGHSKKKDKNIVMTDRSDEDFRTLVDALENNRSRAWTSSEIYSIYDQEHATDLSGHSKNELVQKLEDHFKGDLLVYSENGMATLLVFKDTASRNLRKVILHREILGR